MKGIHTMRSQFRILAVILALGSLAELCSASESSYTTARITIPHVGGWPKTANAMPCLNYARYSWSDKGSWEQKEYLLLPLVAHALADGNIRVTVIHTPKNNRPREIELTISEKCRAYVVNKGSLNERLCVICETKTGEKEAHCFIPGTSGCISCTSAPNVATIEELQ